MGGPSHHWGLGGVSCSGGGSSPSRRRGRGSWRKPGSDGQCQCVGLPALRTRSRWLWAEFRPRGPQFGGPTRAPWTRGPSPDGSRSPASLPRVPAADGREAHGRPPGSGRTGGKGPSGAAAAVPRADGTRAPEEPRRRTGAEWVTSSEASPSFVLIVQTGPEPRGPHDVRELFPQVSMVRVFARGAAGPPPPPAARVAAGLRGPLHRVLRGRGAGASRKAARPRGPPGPPCTGAGAAQPRGGCLPTRPAGAGGRAGTAGPGTARALRAGPSTEDNHARRSAPPVAAPSSAGSTRPGRVPG